MSADNGIYIGKFRDGYRVVEAQAIENCEGQDDLSKAYAVSLFGKVRTFENADEAWAEGRRLYEHCINDFGVCEYGVSEIPFNYCLWERFKSVEEADKFIDEYWKRREKMDSDND